MNDAHEPSHGQPRRPLRLQPLPRPSRPATAEPEPAEAADAEDEPAPEAQATTEWIHEWSEPAMSTDA